ncbi:MAG: PP2C family protein-serine/threonine phosphatase, partial [Pseudanabaena sp. SU_2_4]|nr:PP2C family protein-serine/threonine phosphatase [Pseudanabaena sp. SU_2_4]
LLPKSLNSDIQIDAEFIPSSQLGGDCFDYYWLDADRLVVYLLDTSGHGVGAALLSISVLNLLRSQSLSEVDLSDPSSVMAELNRKFQMNQHGDKYFTMWYGVYNKAEQRLTYASAGHPPALLIPQASTGNARVQKLESLSMPVGFFLNASFTNDECCIEPGSKLYVFSDGVYEIKQDSGKLWGLDRFIELLTTPRLNDKDAKDIKQVVNYIQQVNGSSHFDDDVSLLQVNFN